MLIRIGVTAVGLIAVVLPLAAADVWRWSLADALFLVWLMTPFLLLIASWSSFGRIEQVVDRGYGNRRGRLRRCGHRE
jgi:hypothetical protein